MTQDVYVKLLQKQDYLNSLKVLSLRSNHIVGYKNNVFSAEYTNQVMKGKFQMPQLKVIDFSYNNIRKDYNPNA